MQSLKNILNERKKAQFSNKMNNKCKTTKSSLYFFEKKWKLPTAIITLEKNTKIIKNRIQQNNNNLKKIVFCFLR